MFTGMTWDGGGSAEITISGILGDTDLANANTWAAAEINDIVTSIKAATGITDADIITVPALFYEQSSYLTSYMPQLVGGLCLSATEYAAPDPHGPLITAQDIFKAAFSGKLATLGITVRYVENWDLYHRLNGTLVNGANVTREVSDSAAWWETGL
jgi:protein-arginine deiminase